MTEIATVITVGPGRQENLLRTLDYLERMDEYLLVVIVFDGPESQPPDLTSFERWNGSNLLLHFHTTPRKHEPGMEQPRNVGVRVLQDRFGGLHPTHVWFLDSDVLVGGGTLRAYQDAIQVVGTGAVLIGPYEWMPHGMYEPMPELRSDFRWPMFQERGMGPFVADLGVALGCFGGNLVWPIDEFVRIGGFHPQLHHGRCEDGELGLRAASYRIPMALVAAARGYHVEHERDMAATTQRNARDVPLLNSWHPWVERKGLVVTDQDGARFDFVCGCGEQVNTLEMWAHMASHNNDRLLILPDGL